MYQRESICISDYVSSLKHDVQLVRKSKGTPKHVNIYGYVYDINTDELSLVVEDRSQSPAVINGCPGDAGGRRQPQGTGQALAADGGASLMNPHFPLALQVPA